MLGKLMKYELKATARWFLPLYAALLLFGVINRFLFADPTEMGLEGVMTFRQIVTALSMFVYIFLIVGIMIVTLVVIIQRFYKSLLGDEGYLMFTLPVETWKHTLSKLLVAMLWNMLSALVSVLSILLIVPFREVRGFWDEMIRSIEQVFGAGGFVIFPIMILISAALGILQMYVAIALGHLFNKHKLLASFGMYLGINTIFQFVFMLATPLMMSTFFKSIQTNTIPSPAQINLILFIICITLAVFTVGCYFVTNILLKKKLNLE